MPGGSIAAREAGLRSSWDVRTQSRVRINKVRCQAQAGLELETGTSLLGTGTSLPPAGRAEGSGQSRGRSGLSTSQGSQGDSDLGLQLALQLFCGSLEGGW